MFKLIIVLVSLCGIAVGASDAEVSVQNAVPGPSLAGSGTGGILPGLAGNAGALLDRSRLSFEHTIGITFGSGAFGGLNQYYLNTMSYRVSRPLVIKAQVGIQNNLSGNAIYGSATGNRTQVIVPYVGLLYQPKPNIRIELQFSNLPVSYYGRRYGGF